MNAETPVQSPNGENAECRADGEKGEGPGPANGAHDGWHELDGNCRQQEFPVKSAV